jgi:hypothetical protein
MNKTYKVFLVLSMMLIFPFSAKSINAAENTPIFNATISTWESITAVVSEESIKLVNQIEETFTAPDMQMIITQPQMIYEWLSSEGSLQRLKSQIR